jgi:hypothetical protein
LPQGLLAYFVPVNPLCDRMLRTAFSFLQDRYTQGRQAVARISLGFGGVARRFGDTIFTPLPRFGNQRFSPMLGIEQALEIRFQIPRRFS